VKAVTALRRQFRWHTLTADVLIPFVGARFAVRSLFLACALTGILLVSTSCSQGVVEYAAYTQAFDAQYAQGNSVLDIVAEAERTPNAKKLERRRNSFNPENAAYFLDTVDPPFTAAVRQTLKAVKVYNDALSGLATGEAVNVLAARIDAVATNGAVVVGTAAVMAGGPAAAAGSEAALGATTAAFKALLPALKTIATAASREAFRQQLIEAYPTVRAAIVEMRKDTPIMYRYVYVYLQGDGGAEAVLDEKTLDKDRKLLAGWVILMDKTLVALDAAVSATKAGGSGPYTGTLVDSSIELKVFAEQLKAIQLKK